MSYVLEVHIDRPSQASNLRHYCRNPKCRSKLRTPVANPREAFCTKGCYVSFYLRRCLVCEGPLERKRSTQKVCRKSECRSDFRAGIGFGRYLGRVDGFSQV